MRGGVAERMVPVAAVVWRVVLLMLLTTVRVMRRWPMATVWTNCEGSARNDCCGGGRRQL